MGAGMRAALPTRTLLGLPSRRFLTRNLAAAGYAFVPFT
jgi:hypothetical protein